MARAPQRIREDRWVSLLCLATDLLLVWAGLNLATLLRLDSLPGQSLILLYRDRLMCLVLYLGSAFVMGAFKGYRLVDRFDSIYHALMALFIAAMLSFLSVALLPRDFMVMTRRELGFAFLFSAPLLGIWRYGVTSLATRFSGLYRSFYVFGVPDEAQRIAEAIDQNPEVPAEAAYQDWTALRAGGPVVPENPNRPLRDAIVCVADRSSREFLDLLAFCESCCRRVFIYPSVHDTLLFQQSRLLAIGGVPLVEVACREPDGAYVQIKRLIDMFAAGLGLLLSSPIWITAAVAVRQTSPGGIFYTQERIGRQGHVFRIYKFRTMVQNAEAQTGPVWAQQNDARVTPVGRFLRKHRIDEIPQLWNVLHGDMSLVGPRPERPHFHEEFSQELPLFDRRLAVRPGLTSLSHVLGSYSSAPADRLRYDLVYIGTMSLLNDLKIMFSTIRVVLGGKGAQ